VVETTNFKGDIAPMGFAKWPMSKQAKITETFTLSADGQTLAIKQIYEDPTYIKEPVGRMQSLKRESADVEVAMVPCLETLQGAEEFQKAVGKSY
jgi:hypothetical protein